jgi:hypothetical protein
MPRFNVRVGIGNDTTFQNVIVEATTTEAAKKQAEAMTGGHAKGVTQMSQDTPSGYNSDHHR